MQSKFKWKDGDTQQSVLFWIAVILLVYWGVQRNFNVNELILGIVSTILVGQRLFGYKKDSKESDSEPKKVGENTEQHTKRMGTTDPGDSIDRSVRHRLRRHYTGRRLQHEDLRSQVNIWGRKRKQLFRSLQHG